MNQFGFRETLVEINIVSNQTVSLKSVEARECDPFMCVYGSSLAKYSVQDPVQREAGDDGQGNRERRDRFLVVGATYERSRIKL